MVFDDGVSRERFKRRLILLSSSRRVDMDGYYYKDEITSVAKERSNREELDQRCDGQQ